MTCIWFSILLVLNDILMRYSNNDNNYYSAHAYVTNNGYQQFPIIYNDNKLKVEQVFKGLKFPAAIELNVLYVIIHTNFLDEMI
jgi:hypothetical protein